MRGASRKPIDDSSSAAGSTWPTRISARRPGFCVCASRRRPAQRERTVLVDERHDVGDRGERDDVEVPLEERMAGTEQRLGELPDDACAAETRERIVALQRRDDRAGRERLGRPVVVGDDDLEAERSRMLDLRDGGDAAVDGEHEVEALLGEPRQRAGVQAVALLEARRQMPGDVGVQLAQEEDGERGRADAVGVVVAVHADARARRRWPP